MRVVALIVLLSGVCVALGGVTFFLVGRLETLARILTLIEQMLRDIWAQPRPQARWAGECMVAAQHRQSLGLGTSVVGLTIAIVGFALKTTFDRLQ